MNKDIRVGHKVDNFKEGRYFGVPMLVYHDLCNAPEKRGYPVMKKWCL
jgi:capsule polysaccharide modification protein KpsS